MFDIGGSLAAARRGRGLELPDVEALTRIRAKQLAALEAERWDELPGRAYARAFLRSYATALDLEADLYVAEFEAQVPAEEEDELEAPAPVRRRRRSYPVRAALISVSVVAFVALAAWSETNRPANLGGLAQAQPADAAPKARPVAKPKPRAAPVDRRVVIRAARGNCWLLVRRGGPDGPELYRGTLRHGRVLRFAAPRVWIRLGAPSVVDIHRAATHVRGLPVAPMNVVV